MVGIDTLKVIYELAVDVQEKKESGGPKCFGESIWKEGITISLEETGRVGAKIKCSCQASVKVKSLSNYVTSLLAMGCSSPVSSVMDFQTISLTLHSASQEVFRPQGSWVSCIMSEMRCRQATEVLELC